VDGLVEGLEREQADSDVKSGVEGLLSYVLCEKLSQGLDCAAPEALSLDLQPVFEGRLVDTECFKQVTVIEADRLLERGRTLLADQSFEARRVYDDSGRLEADQITLRADRLDLAFRQDAAEIEEALP